MDLHIWGTSSQPAPFCCESVACALLVNLLNSQGHSIRLVSSSESSYVDCLYYKLPFLRVHASNVVIEGYWSIVKHLNKGSQHSVDRWLSNEAKLLNSGVVNFVLGRLKILNGYNYFVNKTNYDKFTVSQFRHYLRFPLQYYLPLRICNDAVDLSQSLGLSSGKDGYNKENEVSEKAKKKIEAIEKELNLPSLGGIHSEKKKNMLKNLHLLKQTSNNFRVLQLTEESLKRIDIDGKYLSGERKYLFGDQVSSGDLLVIAVLISSLNEELPDRFLGNFLRLRFEKVVEMVEEMRQSVFGET